MNTTNRDDEVMYPVVPAAQQCQHYEQPLVQTQIINHFYLSGEIIEANAYVDMIYKIQTASQDDVVHIHINSPGGDLISGIQIINSMNISEAHIICSLEGEACSMGALIFLAADEFITHDDTILMLHNYSGETYGKGNEQVLALTSTNKWYESIARKYCVPFLTEDELTRMLRGEDFWFQTNEIMRRLIKMIKIKEKQAKKADK